MEKVNELIDNLCIEIRRKLPWLITKIRPDIIDFYVVLGVGVKENYLTSLILFEEHAIFTCWETPSQQLRLEYANPQQFNNIQRSGQIIIKGVKIYI